jgi:hypothetical protein
VPKAHNAFHILASADPPYAGAVFLLAFPPARTDSLNFQ